MSLPESMDVDCVLSKGFQWERYQMPSQEVIDAQPKKSFQNVMTLGVTKCEIDKVEKQKCLICANELDGAKKERDDPTLEVNNE